MHDVAYTTAPAAVASSDCQLVRAFTYWAVDSGLILSRVKRLSALESLCGEEAGKFTQYYSLPLGMALSEIPLSWCGWQVVGNSYARSL